MLAPDRRPGTRVVHAGLPEAAQGEPFLPGPTFAAPFHLAGDSDAAPYGYHRYGNPTWTRYEAALAELEGGPIVLCRCGHSTTKPFCDGTHRSSGFESCARVGA